MYFLWLLEPARLSLRFPFLFFVLFITLSEGCADEPSTRWSISFAEDADRLETAFVEAEILEGGCESPPIDPMTIRPDEGEALEETSFGPGYWGFWARAVSSECHTIAEGCEEVLLPGPETVVTELESVSRSDPPCPADTTCAEGVCVPEQDLCADLFCPPGTQCIDGRCLADDIDEDADGYQLRDDCDDQDSSIHPGALETCNGRDDDCDGEIDQGFDGDGDGYSSCDTSSGPVDCDDHDESIHPGAGETCNGRDDDCDGAIDEDLDSDGDGYSACETASTGPLDCADLDPEVHPGAVERCDGIDWDCDGLAGCGDPDCVDVFCGGPGQTCQDGHCASMCYGQSYAGFGCSECPFGHYEHYCPAAGPECSRACITDDGCSNRYRFDASDEWRESGPAYCYSGTATVGLDWQMNSI